MSHLDLNTIKGSWDDFIGSIYQGHEISDIQYSEMKKAFFAGATTVINIMMLASGDEYTEEQSADKFESLHNECLHFYESMKRKGQTP